MVAKSIWAVVRKSMVASLLLGMASSGSAWAGSKKCGESDALFSGRDILAVEQVFSTAPKSSFKRLQGVELELAPKVGDSIPLLGHWAACNRDVADSPLAVPGAQFEVIRGKAHFVVRITANNRKAASEIVNRAHALRASK